MSYAGDGEQTTTDKQQMASTEASLSQMDLCPEEEDGENAEFSLKKVSAVLQGFSNDLQTQIKVYSYFSFFDALLSFMHSLYR